MPPFPVAETNGTISLYKNLAYLLRFVKRFLLFSNHNLTILLETRNSIPDKVSHSILSQLIHIVFFLYLLQCFGSCHVPYADRVPQIIPEDLLNFFRIFFQKCIAERFQFFAVISGHIAESFPDFLYKNPNFRISSKFSIPTGNFKLFAIEASP